MNETDKTGQCLCGSIRYRILGRCRDIVMCHCSQCLRFHGHHAAYTSVERKNIEINDTEKTLAWYDSSEHARRGFCSKCGSSLFWLKQNSMDIAVAAGSLDWPTGLHSIAHIYTENIADYYTIDDDLAHYEGGLRA